MKGDALLWRAIDVASALDALAALSLIGYLGIITH
jgi:hypothetical protein